MDFDHGRVEARSVAFTDLDASSDGATFTGYAAVFDHEADLGDFTESISRGAFRKALSQGPNVPMLYDHNPGLPVLATTAAGTLKLKEDGRGLRVEANVARHFIGDAVREMVTRGDIRGMSFGFIAGAGNSKIENRGGKPHRNLTGFKQLLDVSPTWDPAYAGTSAELRSLRALQVAEELENDLKDPSRLLKKAAREFRSLTTAQLQNTLEGLQSTAEAIEVALNNVGIGAEVDDPEGNQDIVSGPFTDEQYTDALETIQALVEGAEGLLESAGFPDPDEAADAAETDVSTRSDAPSGAGAVHLAARKRRLALMGATLIDT